MLSPRAAKRLNMNNRGWSRIAAEPTESTQKTIVPEGGEHALPESKRQK